MCMENFSLNQTGVLLDSAVNGLDHLPSQLFSSRRHGPKLSPMFL